MYLTIYGNGHDEIRHFEITKPYEINQILVKDKCLLLMK